MDSMDYATVRDRSKALFGNAHVLPVAEAITDHAAVGADFTAPEVRAWVGGHAADNQIHGVLARMTKAGALNQLPYPGQPHPRRWERAEHPLWRFVAEWAKAPAEPAKKDR
jgi:hypothetical protein